MRSLLLLLLLAPLAAIAQDDSSSDSDSDAVHAVTSYCEDGSKTVTITNPDNHTSEASTYDAGGNLQRKVVYTMGDDNQPVSGIVYDAKGQPAYKTVYKRDEMNRIGEEDDYSMQDQLLTRFVFEFGQDGKILQVHAFDAQGNPLQQTSGQADIPTPPAVSR